MLDTLGAVRKSGNRRSRVESVCPGGIQQKAERHAAGLDTRNWWNKTEKVMRVFPRTAISCEVTLTGHSLMALGILILTSVVEAEYTTPESAGW